MSIKFNLNAFRNIDTRKKRVLAAAAIGAVVICVALAIGVAAEPSAPPPVVAPAAAAATPAAGQGAPTGQVAQPPPAQPPADNQMVRITFTTVPSRNAMVFWGRKRLGVIAPHQPLVVQRPRDSGPLDVVVRSTGFLAVQTRAYTFGDSKIGVKLTATDQKKTLLGYREAPPPEAETPPAGVAATGVPDNDASR
jgi:hypothetical protein